MSVASANRAAPLSKRKPQGSSASWGVEKATTSTSPKKKWVSVSMVRRFFSEIAPSLAAMPSQVPGVA